MCVVSNCANFKEIKIENIEISDILPIAGDRSRDYHHFRDRERPMHKDYRPFRNRAIVYALMETGMSRAAVCNIDFEDVDAASFRSYKTVDSKSILAYKIFLYKMAFFYTKRIVFRLKIPVLSTTIRI
jgi:hypothetical protein